MHIFSQLPDLLQNRLDRFLASQRESLVDIGTDPDPLFDSVHGFLEGGKRFRARFLTLGFLAVQPLEQADEQQTAAVIDAATALELFHAAALIHDDLIDQSATRRGKPAIHTTFAALHRNKGFRGNADRFGGATAILIGDLLQSWADELMNNALSRLPRADCAQTARSHFNRMRSEVAVGQYLDVLEEQLPAFAEHQEQLERSTRVLIYKSAKYSVQAPLSIGAAMAGATELQARALADFGLPVGVAFQLRDDMLGVFGDEQVTGKPAGDDLAEGKRTVLVTLAREALPAGPQRVFDSLLGSEDLDETQISMLQRTINETDAPSRIEHMITANVGIAREALDGATLHPTATQHLLELADRATQRNA